MESVSYILAGTLIDGTDAQPRRDVALAVDSGIIVEIVHEATALPRGAEVVDIRDYWVMPGLINMHAHVTLTGWARVGQTCLVWPYRPMNRQG